jgi:hypothetical protein
MSTGNNLGKAASEEMIWDEKAETSVAHTEVRPEEGATNGKRVLNFSLPSLHGLLYGKT